MTVQWRLLVLALALAGGGCNHFGLGSPYPGAASRYREFDVYRNVVGDVYQKVGRGSETGGGGAYGGLAGIRIGGGPISLGDRPSKAGIALDARVELDLSLSRRLGVGVTGGWGMTGVDYDDGDQLTYRYWPVTGHISWVPRGPFLLRATVGYQRGTATLNGSSADETTASGGGLIYGASAGLTVPFPGAHFVVLLDYQHLDGGSLDLGAGNEALAVDAVLWQLWYIL